MEQETNILHLFTSHQIIMFLVCSALILTAMLVVGIQIGKWQERRQKRNNGQSNSN